MTSKRVDCANTATSNAMPVPKAASEAVSPSKIPTWRAAKRSSSSRTCRPDAWWTGTKWRSAYRKKEFLMDEYLTGRPLRPLDEDISRAILKMKERDRIWANLPRIDCGACGAPSCRAFAEDVVLGDADKESCVFFWRRELEDRIEQLASLVRTQRQASRRTTMNVAEAAQRIEGTLMAGSSAADREIQGGYASDLLSDVMGNSREGDIWVTLQKHVNIVAVAQLNGLAAIVLVNGRKPEPDTVARADEIGIPIISTPLQAFDAIGILVCPGHSRKEVGLKVFMVDTHIHTCLSPCAELDMHPSAIVDAAVRAGLDSIAVCDHNSAENAGAVQRAGNAAGLAVIPGMEITSAEEVHILGLLPGHRRRDGASIQGLPIACPGEMTKTHSACR